MHTRSNGRRFRFLFTMRTHLVPRARGVRYDQDYPGHRREFRSRRVKPVFQHHRPHGGRLRQVRTPSRASRDREPDNVPPEVFGRGGLEYAAAKSNVLDLAAKFVLEITERGVPDKLGIKEINTRPRKGVLVALDDVCESDARFLLAQNVQVDILKIEKSAVEKITRATLSSRQVSSLYALIQTAHVAVIAEGVETESQARKLLNFGIRLAQGWLFSHPLSARDFMSYFSSHINPSRGRC